MVSNQVHLLCSLPSPLQPSSYLIKHQDIFLPFFCWKIESARAETNSNIETLWFQGIIFNYSALDLWLKHNDRKLKDLKVVCMAGFAVKCHIVYF